MYWVNSVRPFAGACLIVLFWAIGLGSAFAANDNELTWFDVEQTRLRVLHAEQAYGVTPDEARYRELISLARNGEPARVLPELRALAEISPGDVLLLADLFVVTTWAQREQEAVDLLPALDRVQVPDYVLPAAVRLGRSVIQRGERYAGQSVLAFVERQRSLQPQAFSLALELELLRLAGDLGEWLPAMREADRLMLQYPQSRELVLFKADAATASGSYSIALDLLERHPQWFSREQAVAIRQDWQSQWVRIGASVQEASDSPERLAASSTAVAHGYQWLENNDPGDPLFDRSRFDQIAALRDRDAMDEVVSLYRTLEGPVPDYVVLAAAQAHLRLRQPQKAASLFELAIGGRKTPETWDWRVSLSYALLDSEQPAAALEQIDEVATEIQEALMPDAATRHDQGVRYWRERIEVIRANFERFSQRFDLAQLRLREALNRAPFDPDVRIAQAGLFANRQAPRAALAIIDRVSHDFPDSAPARFAQTEVLLDLNEMAQARSNYTDLRSKLGEHPRLDHLHARIVNKIAPWAKIAVDSAVGNDTALVVTPARERRVDAYAESALLDNNFRLVANSNYHRAALPEGDTVRRRNGFGVLTEHAGWGLSVLGYAGLNNDAGGYTVRARASPSDSMSVTGSVAANSMDAPLRAYRQAIKLNTAQIQVDWRKLEYRQVSASYERGKFSDQNIRDVVSANWREDWIRQPHHSFSTQLTVSSLTHQISQTPYFSPSRYGAVSLAFILQQTLSRTYDRWWKHQLRFEPAVFMQAGHVNKIGGTARYEHEMELTHRFGVRAAISNVRRAFDGIVEGRWIASFDTFWRF